MPITITHTTAQWSTKNPILASGQYGFEEETGRVKRGDGSSRWSQLSFLSGAPYTIPAENDSFFGGATNKAQIGLGNVDNTADVDKPVSTPQRAALVPFWAPNEVVAQDAVRMTALGLTIKRNAAGTTRPSYDGTEAALSS